MKICIFCSEKFTDPAWKCPHCATTPEVINNHYAFASALSIENGSFPVEYYDDLADAEKKHFWFNARKDLIIWALKKYFPQAKTFFEIGCGTGFILANIADQCKNLQILGSEIHSDGLAHTAKRINNIELIQMDARHIPFENEFDLIGAFDILEHIHEDTDVIKQIHKALKPKGGILLTVPQHPFLWSQADEYLHHVRRYTANDLKNKLLAAGFRIKLMTSFISFLLPIMFLSRFFQKKNYDPLHELKINDFNNKILQMIFKTEFMFIKKGFKFPAGGSLFIVAEKTT